MGKLFDGKPGIYTDTATFKISSGHNGTGCHSNDRQSHPGTAPCTCED